MMYKNPKEVVFMFKSQEKLYTSWFKEFVFYSFSLRSHPGGTHHWLMTEPIDHTLFPCGLLAQIRNFRRV